MNGSAGFVYPLSIQRVDKFLDKELRESKVGLDCLRGER
jgi:hypothetical protein